MARQKAATLEVVPTRPSLSDQIRPLTAANRRAEDILELAIEQHQAATDELYAAWLTMEGASIPGTYLVARYAAAAGRAAMAAVEVEERPATEPEPLVEPPPPEDRGRD